MRISSAKSGEKKYVFRLLNDTNKFQSNISNTPLHKRWSHLSPVFIPFLPCELKTSIAYILIFNKILAKILILRGEGNINSFRSK